MSIARAVADHLESSTTSTLSVTSSQSLDSPWQRLQSAAFDILTYCVALDQRLKKIWSAPSMPDSFAELSEPKQSQSQR